VTIKAVIGSDTDDGFSIFIAESPMAALVVHASKDGEGRRMLYTSPSIAVAKARSLFKTGWEDVHIVDADGGLFYPDKFDRLLSFDRKPAIKF
jgi:hypothetical protein